MLKTSLGRILVADHEGVYVIKMVGDVRLTLCVSFDQYIEILFGKNDFCTILFDLAEAEGLDSTTLGLIAKIAVKSEAVKNIKPIIICNSPDILKLLNSMAIDTVCQIIENPPQDYCATSEFSCLDVAENEESVVKEKVLEAHCVLMGLNESNRETFKDLVKTLDSH
ncbi:MAG: anti-anti-sigma regulatory factor [Candidatus Endobugula sp.]|jgi:anti-anti-sigma regulatory factor